MYQQRQGIEVCKPKLEILSLNDSNVRFVLSDCDVSVANALRRVMIAEVPTMAIHFVDMIENTSPIMDEFLAQRLGLIPLNSVQADIKRYDWEEVESDAAQDDLKTRAIFSLKVRNHNDEPLDVTSKDLEPEIGFIGNEDAIKPIKYKSPLNPEIENGIPIVKLGKNQGVQVRCHALKGYGKMHAKWSPVNIATFQQEADIHIDENIHSLLNDLEKREIVDACPKKVLDINRNGQIEVVNSTACIFCEECQRKSESFKKPRLFKIATKPNKYIFYVESTGQLKAAEIVKKAFGVLREKLENLNSEFSQTLNQNRRF